MNNLHGIVLELFKKDKKKQKIKNILYGKKALEKYIEVSFKGKSVSEKKKYKKNWDYTKVDNSVYFVYKGRGNKIGHRFISNSWKDGGHSYLGHLEHVNKRSKKKKIKQKGGLIPCAPCAMAAPGVISSMSAGTAALGAGALGTGVFMSRSSSGSSFFSKKGDNVKRKEVYEFNDNGKKTKKVFSLDKVKNGIKLNLGGKKSKSRSLKNAMKKFNKAVKTCKRKGFKKC